MARVLVVDDVADSAVALADRLAAAGHDATTAFDGKEALEQFARIRPDMVVMDLDMPVMDGYAAAEAIRLLGAGDPRWMIALTGEPRETAERRALACGFDRYLQKPVDFAALRALLDT